MRARHLRALAAVAALTLSGCGGEDEPVATSTSTPMPTVHDTDSSSSDTASSGTSSPSTSGSTSGGSSPSSSVSTEPPEEAQENTKAGAEAFAKWYVEQTGQVLVTTDADTLKKYANKSCVVCDGFIEAAQSYREKGWKADKNPYIVRLKSSEAESEVTNVRLGVREDEYAYVDKTGNTHDVDNADANAYDIVATVRWDNGRWGTDELVMIR